MHEDLKRVLPEILELGRGPALLGELAQMTVDQLANTYRELYGEPTRSRNKGYLRKRLAWRISEQATRVNGRARELVEAQLVVESDRLLAAEKQLASVNCDLMELAAESTVTGWVLDALRNFTSAWDMLTPENKGRLLRILVFEVRIDDKESAVEIELAGFVSPNTKEAA